MKTAIYSILILALILLAGCSTFDSNTLRTAEAMSFTVGHPYSWTREFVSFEVEDPSVIPQGIDETKPYMVIYPPHIQTTPTTKILFFVNDLTMSELSFEEYLTYVEESTEDNFQIINKSITDTTAIYNYNYQNVYEIKKFLYQDGLLLTAIATIPLELKEEYTPIFMEIIDSINLRESSNDLTNQYSSTEVLTENNFDEKPISENEINTISEIPSEFDEEVYNQIVEQSEKVYENYKNCYNIIAEKGNKINAVRDMKTLSIFDGYVKDCVATYLTDAVIFTNLINENPNILTSESKIAIQKEVLDEVSNLKTMSIKYSQLSNNRRNYIHNGYQTKALINLGTLIGEGVASVSKGDVVDSITSLYELEQWYYYNGGTINTGWD
jgi:hypothetical protein